jgi:hypothetical protein
MSRVVLRHIGKTGRKGTKKKVTFLTSDKLKAKNRKKVAFGVREVTSFYYLCTLLSNIVHITLYRNGRNKED